MLRVVTHRLETTPEWQKPQTAVYLANTLTSGGELLIGKDIETHARNEQTAFLVNKFKSQISVLLLSKNPRSRWAAIILIKAIIEVEGWEIQYGAAAWVRGLLRILERSDPDCTKVLCVVTLTRIFRLVVKHQSLVREIINPSLPGFVTSCLNVLKSQLSPLEEKRGESEVSITVAMVLQSFCELIPWHPNLFRPFVSQIREIVLPFIAPTPSSLQGDNILQFQQSPLILTAASVAQPSRKLFALLSFCAPKNSSGEDWTKSFHKVLDALHSTADRVFRGLLEEWEPTAAIPQIDVMMVRNFAEIVNQVEDPLGLPTWKGIYGGMERMEGLLQCLQMFLVAATSTSIAVPIGTLLDAMYRTLSVRTPSTDENGRYSTNERVHSEVTRDECEGIWAGLTKVHVLSLEILSILVLRLGHGCAPALDSILDLTLWVCEEEHASPDIRKTTYEIVAEILPLFGLSLSARLCSSLSKCIKLCCEDLVPPTEQPHAAQAPKASSSQPSSTNVLHTDADSYIKPLATLSRRTRTPLDVQVAAAKLLPLLAAGVHRNSLSFSIRSLIDRTAVLTQNKNAMLASILNAPVRQKGVKEISSIMPFLAREYPSALEAQALLRPRMPVLQTASINDRDVLSEMEIDVTLNQNYRNAVVLGNEITNTGIDSVADEQVEDPMISHGRSSSPDKEQSQIINDSLLTPKGSSPNSRKRHREWPHTLEVFQNATEAEELPSNSSSDLISASKRARLDTQDVKVECLTKSGTLEIPEIPEIQGSLVSKGSHSPEVSLISSREASPKEMEMKLIDSDESEFEMPILDTELDTETEEDEEELPL